MPRLISLAAAALTALLVALAAAGLLGARAAGGVPIPAEAGTQWEIVAGYNTGTHSDADGGDRQAIDLVRTDAATAGSAVLAPTSGSISYASSDCLSIRDAAGMEHLLCHIQPAAGLRRGSQVVVGEHVGTVWADGLGNNGGLAHIHYAVHHSRGSGYMGETVPFVGAYAIEGVELQDGSDFNLHGGAAFTSTNRLNWQAPATTTSLPAGSGDGDGSDADEGSQAAAPDDGGAAGGASGEEPSSDDGSADDARAAAHTHEHGDGAHTHEHDDGEDDARAATTAAARRAVRTVTGGWRLIAIDQPTTLAAVWSRRGSTLTSLFFWDRFGQRWQRYQPELPGGAAAGRIALAPGDAVLGPVQEEAAWLPRIAQASSPPTVELRAGWNLVSWHGGDAPPATAFAALDSLVAAFLWDNEQQRYLRWGPEDPDLINTLETVTPGSSLWLELRRPEVWPQGG